MNADQSVEDETYSYCSFPSDPLAIVLFFMLVYLNGRYLTNEAATVVMSFLNIALDVYGKTDWRFPKNIKTFVRYCHFEETCHSGIKTYASCTRCHAIHPYNTPMEKARLQTTKTCKSKPPFPNSLHCNAPLFDDRQILPRRTYYYNSLVNTLRTFFKRQGFFENITAWKNRRTHTPTGLMTDIYDGNVWNTFKVDSSPSTQVFTQESDFNLMLALNIDWFQLYEGSQHSSGAIYLTIQNLPREVRNLKTNVILVGVIPGPSEPRTFELNHLIKPLVDELLQLMYGVEIQTSLGLRLVKACLTLVVSDLLACQKLCGFTSHSSRNACFKCKRHFFSAASDSTGLDFTNFDISSLRTNQEHRENAEKWCNARNATERKELEKENGTRWSELLRLPYFDAPRFCVFDLLHNSYLGTVKRLINLWRDDENPLLSNQDLNEITKASSSNLVLPYGYDGVSSISRKISIGKKGFSHMKGDELKTFTVAMSSYLLVGKLPSAIYDNFMLFVEANRLLMLPALSFDDIEKIDRLLKEFLEGILEVYDDPVSLITSNQHYHLHFKSCLYDYGPCSAFWTFNFERYNSLLKNVRNNHRGCIEGTLMKGFLNMVHHNDYFMSHKSRYSCQNSTFVKLQDLYLVDDPLVDIVSDNAVPAYDYAALLEMLQPSTTVFGHEPLPIKTINAINTIAKVSTIKNDDDFRSLLEFYGKRYNRIFFADNSAIQFADSNNAIAVTEKIWKFNSINIFGNRYRSMEASTKNKRGSFVLCYYELFEFGVKNIVEIRPCQIQYFFTHSIKFPEEKHEKTSVFAFVRWFKKPDVLFSSFNNKNNMEVCKNNFEHTSSASVVPVTRIISPIAIKLDHLSGHNIILKLPRKLVF